MNKPSCPGCRYARVEKWSKKMDALRCWNERNGKWCGRVTELFGHGKIAAIRGHPAPAWCVLRERERGNREREAGAS